MSKLFIGSLFAILTFGVGFFYVAGAKTDKELQAVRLELAETKGALEQANMALAEAKQALETKPELPVSLSYREALMGSGYVVQFKNTLDRNITVGVICKRPGSGDQKTFSVDLAPNQPREIGHMEGWAFKSGDLIALTHTNYSSLERSIK